MFMDMDACVTARMWRSGDNFWGSVLSSHDMGPGKQTRVTGLPSGQCLTHRTICSLLLYTSSIYLKFRLHIHVLIWCIKGCACVQNTWVHFPESGPACLLLLPSRTEPGASLYLAGLNEERSPEIFPSVSSSTGIAGTYPYVQLFL